MICFLFAVSVLWIPFVQTPLNEINDSLVDLSFLNQNDDNKIKSIVRKNGHFYYNGTETQVRFFGTNVGYKDAFPEKSLAMGIAKRLSQLGINVVRFHQMDAVNIWNEDYTDFSAEELDKLHYFIYCLHQNGIYAYISLHVTYVYRQEEFTANLQKVFLYGKALDIFYEPFIQDQIKYIKLLIGSYNNYTKCYIYEDPGVAFIELNNENDISLIIDNADSIKNTKFHDSLVSQWHDYLNEKFETYDNFYKRLNEDPIDTSTDLAESTETKVNLGSANENTCDNNNDKNTYNIHIKAKGTSTISFQLLKMKFFKSSRFYTIKFKASAEFQTTASINLQYGVSKFEAVTTGVRIELTTELQEYNIEIKINEDLNETKPVQLSVIFNKDINEYIITKPKIYLGKKTWDPPGDKNLDSLPLPDCSKNSNDALQFQAEYRLFLNYTQTKTQLRLFDVLRKEFNCTAQLTDSQANYGDYMSFHRKYTYDDYIDIHYYWAHPTFTEGHSFEIAYYSTDNSALVDNNYLPTNSLFKILPFVGHERPFTISELNNPFPNEHQHETFPMIASWAAYHDLDGFYEFSYGQKTKPEDTAYVQNFFQMASNPVLMITAPVAAIMFRTFAVKTANASLTMQIPRKALLNANEKRTVKYNNLYSSKQRDLCWKPTRIEFTDDDTEDMKLSSNECENATTFPYQTEEITWKFDEQNKGLYIVDSERVKTATGHVKDINFGSFNFSISLQNFAENTATVGVTSLDMKPLEKSEKILLIVVGRTMNTGQKWDKDKTTTKENWGKAPVLAECIDISGSFLDGKNAKLHVLNKDGQDNGTLPLQYDENANKWSFASDASNPSIWYVITREMESQESSDEGSNNNPELSSTVNKPPVDDELKSNSVDESHVDDSKSDPADNPVNDMSYSDLDTGINDNLNEKNKSKVGLIVGIVVPIVVVAAIVIIVAVILIRKKANKQETSDVALDFMDNQTNF